MKRLICICIAVILLAPVLAMGMTGNELMEAADSKASDSLFVGYVCGVADDMGAWMHLGNVERIYCIPDGATYGQMKEVVRKYLKDHPEELHMRGSILVLKAFSAAWPCK